MGKKSFQKEIEIKATPRLLYEYIATPAGLEKWFADEVALVADEKWRFVIGGVEQMGQCIAFKNNKFIKFEFDKEGESPASLELRLERNELTQTMYLLVDENSDWYDDHEEFNKVWDGLIAELCEILGA